MQGYTKHFTDGSTELITDDLVKANKASWQRGRLHNISAVDLHMDDLLITLSSPGEYWVADDYINIVRIPSAGNSITVPSQCIARRVERKLTEEDIGKWIILEIRDEKMFHMYLSSKEGPCSQYQVTQEHIDKWLILEYDLQKASVGYRLANNK